MTALNLLNPPLKHFRIVMLAIVIGAVALTGLGMDHTAEASEKTPPEQCSPEQVGRMDWSTYGLIYWPGDQACYEVWLDGGYTYTVKVDLVPWSPGEFTQPGSALHDSVLEVYKYKYSRVPFYWNPDEYELVGENDDVNYPYDLSSRVIFTVSAGSGYLTPDRAKFLLNVRGYSSQIGSFKITISRSVVASPNPCRTVFC